MSTYLSAILARSHSVTESTWSIETGEPVCVRLANALDEEKLCKMYVA
jgi:hypothetical protein